MNQAAASKKNNRGPVAGRPAPCGQAITAIPMAISACNEFPTRPVHEWRLVAGPYTHSVALMTKSAVTIQRRKRSWITRRMAMGFQLIARLT
jgi:hypothetical protein